jgi:hypothetical protein
MAIRAGAPLKQVPADLIRDNSAPKVHLVLRVVKGVDCVTLANRDTWVGVP